MKRLIRMKNTTLIYLIGLVCWICACTGSQQIPTPNVYKSSLEATSVLDSAYEGSVVHIVYEDDAFKLYRNGKPFFIKGGAGRQKMEELKKAGGNTLRTWVEGGLDTILNQAQDLGLTVFAGLHFNRERDGFDYNNQILVYKQRERILNAVKKYKDHPALLAWGIGNEPELGAQNDIIWSEINWLAEEIHRIDPNHPVTAVCQPVKSSLNALAEKCPALDFLAFNIFDDLVEMPGRLKNSPLKLSKPYIISEWGPTGYWETNLADWFAPLERFLPQKIELMKAGYEKTIRGDEAHCLGGFVFYWGQKQERTHTWFSMFMENGDKTALVDLMYELWETGSPENKAPIITALTFNDQELDSPYFASNSEMKASVIVNDTDGDTLNYVWEILPEGGYDGIIGGDAEVRPAPIKGLFLKNEGSTLHFNIPAYSGAYRLFCHAYDGKGGGGYINVPFFVSNNELKD